MSGDTTRASRAGSGEMSRGCDVAEGTLPQWTVLLEMMAGSTLETPVVVEGARMGRGLSSKGSSSIQGAMVASSGRSGASNEVWVLAAVSCRRKDGRNHPSESRKIEGWESGALAKQRGYGARTLCRSGDCWCGGDGVHLVNRVGGRGDDSGVREFEGDPSILV